MLQEKTPKNPQASYSWPRHSSAPGSRPYSPADFRELDRASLQSDPVAAATEVIKRVRPDSVKGWPMTKILTPYLVSTACGKRWKRATRGNDWGSRRRHPSGGLANAENCAEFNYFSAYARHPLHSRRALCLGPAKRFANQDFRRSPPRQMQK